MDAPKATSNVWQFAPEIWSQLDKFSRFCQTTYSFSRIDQKRLNGIFGHADRAALLAGLAIRMQSSLDEDVNQVETTGYSPALRSKELAAIIDSIFCELYSILLDCTRHVLFAIFPNHAGMVKSTRGTFQRGHKRQLDPRLPIGIRDAIADTADWYDDLRQIRDEVTHANVGSCWRNSKDEKVAYMHDGLGSRERCLVMEDVFAEIEGYFAKINAFLNRVFEPLNSTLKDVPVVLFCGVFGSRLFMREVRPSEATHINAGICHSREWFDRDGIERCPFADHCGAYRRAIEQREVLNPSSEKQ